VKRIANASPAASSLAMRTKPRRRSAITALFAAAIALLLVLPSFASADPLGTTTLFNSGLRGQAFVKALAKGPDGNVWFVDTKNFAPVPEIGRITSTGTITEYPLKAENTLSAITAGPKAEKYLWFTDQGATPAIGRIDSEAPGSEVEATVNEFSTGLNVGSKPLGITLGPDGNLWFTDQGTTSAIGMIEPGGENKIKECSTGLNLGSQPTGIAAGPDGNLWFTDVGTTQAVGRVNPSTCAIKEFETGAETLPGGLNSSTTGLRGITAGVDGNVWFTEAGAKSKAICHITPSGTDEEIKSSLKCFKEGLIGSSSPLGLTAAPDGKLWFTDNSGANEEQEVEVTAAASLGGIYNLCFEGKCTGWKGEASLTGESGEGELNGWEGTGDVTTTSKEVKNVVVKQGKVEVGQEFGCASPTCGIAAGDKIEKCEPSCTEPNTIFLTAAASGAGSGVGKTLRAGSKVVKNVTTTAGTFTVGHTIEGAGIHPAGVTISAVEEEGKKLVLSRVAVNTGTFALTAGTKSVSGATTTSGTLLNGEAVSGAGIQEGTTVSSVNEEAGTFTLSKVASNTGKFSLTGGFSPRLEMNSTMNQVLDQLSTINAYGEPEITVSGVGTTSPVKRRVNFEGGIGNADVEQMTCDATALTGTSPACSVTTSGPGVNGGPGSSAAIGRISMSGKITRYPNKQFSRTLGGITEGPGGNVWFSAGFTEFQKIGKLGIEPIGPELTVHHEGTGEGTVQSSPEGITCTSGDCSAEFETGKEVTLTASPAEGSLFVAWKNCDVGGVHGRQCTVHVTAGHKPVGAKFEPANTVTVKTKGNGTGSVSGVTCGNTCTEAQGIFLASKAVTLKAKPYTKTSEFKGWTASPASCTLSEGGLTCSLGLLSANETVEAEFAEIARENLKVTKSGKGQGAVKSSPAGINCSYTCPSNTAYYYKGTSVTLTASVQEGKGSALGNWGGACSGTAATPCVVSMSSAKEVTVEFK
jgi:streptogramin lyase